MPQTGEFLSWIRAATRAPSIHNTQPWRFELHADGIVARLDPTRALGATDPEGRERWMSLGCAVENMVVAARHDGELLEVEPPSARDGSVALRARRHRTAPDGLYQAIVERQTNHRLYDGHPLDPAVIEALERIRPEPGIHLRLLTDPATFAPLARLAEIATVAQMGDGRVRDELRAWTRFTEREVAESLDGMNAHALALHPPPGWLARALFPILNAPKASAARQASLVQSASAIVVLGVTNDAPREWLGAGRTLERLLLHLTLLGVQHDYFNEIAREPSLHQRLAWLVRFHDMRPVALLRLGRAPAHAQTPRRTLDDVIVHPTATDSRPDGRALSGFQAP